MKRVRTPPGSRELGITVLGDFLVSEGVDAVLTNLLRVGATAVACNPTVSAPCETEQGTFQPPSDAGTSPRTFDRELFGQHALWLRSGVSYRPRVEFYKDSPYKPRVPNDLTEQHGAIIGQFIEAATTAGLKVVFQLPAAQPSGLRDEDRPRLPDGTIPEGRMANTGSLASEAIRVYNRAYVRDLAEEYPLISGFRIDWPEYPCYTAGEIFQDFGQHVERWANEHGFDFAAIRQKVAEVREMFLGTDASALIPDSQSFTDESLATPELAEWLRLKAALSVDLLQHWRETIDEHAGPDKTLCGHAFMPPYCTFTGFDFAAAGAYCNSISPKLYTMHWSLMVKFWGEALMAANPILSEQTVVAAMVQLMDLKDDSALSPQGDTFADYGYPLPDEPHPIGDEPQRRKISQVSEAVGDRSALVPLVHGYGPSDDFERRLRLVAESDVDGIWINRYGYLGDEKLEVIGRTWG